MRYNQPRCTRPCQKQCNKQCRPCRKEASTTHDNTSAKRSQRVFETTTLLQRAHRDRPMDSRSSANGSTADFQADGKWTQAHTNGRRAHHGQRGQPCLHGNVHRLHRTPRSRRTVHSRSRRLGPNPRTKQTNRLTDDKPNRSKRPVGPSVTASQG